MVEVFLLSFGDHLRDPVSGHQVSQGSRLRSIVDHAVAAEAAGFTGFAVGEHHFSDYLVSAPDVLLAAVAARTSRLRLSTAVTLLGLDDPVRVAERLCLLDQLSDGRAELVVARGVSSTRTWAAFGCADETAVRARTAESLELLLRLLTERDVGWTGTVRPHLDQITVQPRPRQRPRPRVWMGGGLSPLSAELAARHELPLLLPSTLRPPGDHWPSLDLYRRRMGERSAPPATGLPIHVWVHEDHDEAIREWTPYLRAYATFAAAARGGGGPIDVPALLRGPAVCGDPAAVAARLTELVTTMGLDRVMVVMDVGGAPPDRVRRTIELFGATVLPMLRTG